MTISFLNLFISLIELKTFLYFINYLFLFLRTSIKRAQANFKIHLFYKQSKIETIVKQFVKQPLNHLPGRTRHENQTIHRENRLKLFFCIGNLRVMLTFGLVSSKVRITYSRCPCNKLWRRLECLNIETIEVNRPSTKQFLNIFWGRFFRKA